MALVAAAPSTWFRRKTQALIKTAEARRMEHRRLKAIVNSPTR
jgi:hypothetical protein